MPTLASCPPSKGFTLLELLIVLALVSAMAAVVVPGLQRGYEAIQTSGQRADVVRQIETLPISVRNAGRALDVAPDAPAQLSGRLALPAGWAVMALEPFQVAANGVCSGGRIQVSTPTGLERWQVARPDCAVSMQP